jgi:hypothetical protein
MGESEYGLIIGFVVFALLWLRFYLWPKKTRQEKQIEKAREEALERESAMWEPTSQRPPNQPWDPYDDSLVGRVAWASRAKPMGPSAPTGLPDAPPPPPPPAPPLGGKFGPQYLTGALKTESEEALQLLHRHTNDIFRQKLVERTGSPHWPTYYAMAADWLGAMRWSRKVVYPDITDRQFSEAFREDSLYATSKLIDEYRKLPPGAERDQALKILDFYSQHIRTELVREAEKIIVHALLQKAHEDWVKAGRKGVPPG